MTKPIVLYTGPSMLDGFPIVVLATLDSSNVKTGRIVQTWIMRADSPPHTAGAVGDDLSVCGMCPRRHFLGGDCYVIKHQGPLSTWKNWERAGKPDADLPSAIDRIREATSEYGLRLGSYGDPAAVPSDSVWIPIIKATTPRICVGYTHQHKALNFVSSTNTYKHVQWCRENLMASCDTPEEAVLASAGGWRYFLAVPVGVAPPPKAIMCLADRENSTKTCSTCGICDGSQKKATRASVFLNEHGAKSISKGKRLAALRVIQPNA